MTTISCTPFCERLKRLGLDHGNLPSHSSLLQHFEHFEDLEKGFELGIYTDLLQRTQCRFCRLVLNSVKQNIDSHSGQPEDRQQIRVLLFPGEQSFRLSYPSRLGTRIAFIAIEARLATGPDNARLSTGTEQSPLVRSWLESCVKGHPDCALESVKAKSLDGFQQHVQDFNEDATSNFRLIDLERGCIIHAALDEKYVALSYVWGNLPMLMLKTTNFEDLSIEGSLDSLRSELPRTINDVIDFVKAIGERYLWVDGLCLVQDDHEDVTLGIQMMNSIYHGAYCTIVAASGVDANVGLFSDPKHPRSVEKVAPGLNMTILHSIDWYLNISQYQTRGWTLQELVLSRRTIIFIDGQVHFRCRSANWSQDSWAEKWLNWQDPDDSNITRIPGLLNGRLEHMWPYQKLMEEFSRRALRRDGDALRATAAITRSLAAGMQTDLIEGLPGYYLDHFLLFMSANGNLQRRPEFGSFSWAGWSGHIMWPRENFAWYDDQNERTWEVANILKYFKHNRIVDWSSINFGAECESLTSSSYGWHSPVRSSPLLRLMQEYPDIFEDLFTEPDTVNDGPLFSSGSSSHADLPKWDLESETEEPTIPKKKRGFPIKAFDLINGQAEFDRMVQHVDDVYERLTLYNWQAVRASRARDAQQRQSKYGPRLGSDPQQFEFRDPSAERRKMRMRVDERREMAQRSVATDQVPDFPPYDVLECKTMALRLTLGALPKQERQRTSPFDRIAGIPLYGRSGALAGSLHLDDFNMMDAEGSSVELVIITRCSEPTVGSALHGLENQGPLPWRMFWVMYIVWKDNIAERRGIGQVLASAIEDSVGPRPEVKRILLR